MPYIIKNGLTYTGNLIPITQARYDDLSEAEKNNGVAYFIVDSDAVLDASDVGLGEGNVEDLAGSVAVIETSPATAVHAEGSYIVWDGQLYTVISRIEVGQALTVGSNITATTAGSELSSLKSGLTSLGAVVRTITVRSSTPITIQTGTYAMILFLGFAQGIGSVAIAVKRISSGVSAYDITTGTAFSSSYLKFEQVSGGVRVTSTSDSSSVFTVILGSL